MVLNKQAIGISKERFPKRITPLKSIRNKCIDCAGFDRKEVRNCQHLDCTLYPLRMGKGARATLKNIRAFCLRCCNNEREGVRLCPSVTCPLWEYRFGKRSAKLGKCLVLPETLTTAGVLEKVEA